MLDFTEPSAIEPGSSCAPANASARLLDLDDVADAGRRAVALDERALRGRQPGVAPAALDREPLADRVGRGDALALAVAGAADAAHDGVDAVAVALGVGEALEHEQRRRPRPSRSRRRRRRTGACRSATARRSRRTSRSSTTPMLRSTPPVIDDVEVVRSVRPSIAASMAAIAEAQAASTVKFGPAEVEEVGDPAGDAVGQLAGHRVLGDRRQPGLDVAAAARARSPRARRRAAPRSSRRARARARTRGT